MVASVAVAEELQEQLLA
jgi:hypothetical protein